MSASTTQWYPLLMNTSPFLTAAWALVLGLYPWLCGRNISSKIGSSTFFNACWTTLSLTVGIPSFLILPLSFGINTLKTGRGSWRFSFSSLCISFKFCCRFCSNCSMVIPSTPALPLFAFTLFHACTRFFSLHTLCIRANSLNLSWYCLFHFFIYGLHRSW